MTTKQTKEPETKDTVDWKHATVRQNCLNEAINVCGQEARDEVISLADKMYRFVIGEPIDNALSTPTNQQEWK